MNINKKTAIGLATLLLISSFSLTSTAQAETNADITKIANALKFLQTQLTIFIDMVSVVDPDFFTSFVWNASRVVPGAQNISSVPVGNLNTTIITPRWSYQGENQVPGLGWKANIISLGNNGNHVVSGYAISGYFSNPPNSYSLLFSSNSLQSNPLLTYIYPQNSNHSMQVDSAKYADIYATLMLEQNTGENYGKIRLKRFTSTSASPDWSVLVPSSTIHSGSGEMFNLKVSDDGTKIFVWLYENSLIYYYVYNTSNGALFSGYPKTISTVFGIGTLPPSFAVSGDLSTVIFSGYSTLKVVDVATAQVLKFEIFSSGTGNSIDISSDGNEVAYIINGNSLRILERPSQGVVYSTNILTLPSGLNYRPLTISSDGSTIVYAYRDYVIPTLQGVVALDLVNNNQETMRYEYTSYGSHNSFPNYASDISINDDGSRFAVGYFGGPLHETAEIKVFNSTQNNPLFDAFAIGPVEKLEIAPLGDRMVSANTRCIGLSCGLGEINMYDLP